MKIGLLQAGITFLFLYFLANTDLNDRSRLLITLGGLIIIHAHYRTLQKEETITSCLCAKDEYS